MAIDACYQAMPDDSPILERARRDPDFASNLPFFNDLKSMRQLCSTDPSDVDMLAEATKLLAQHPGLENRTLRYSRKWDRLYYLLSTNRRSQEKKDPSLPEVKFIFGGGILHPEGIIYTGYHVRFLPASEVALTYQYVQPITKNDLEQHYDPLAMDAASVYKISEFEDPENFEYDWEFFEQLRELFATAVKHHEGMLTWLC